MAGAVIEALMGNQASRLITPFGELSPEEATERIDLCVLKIGYLVAQSLHLFEKLGVVGLSIGATLRPLLNLCRHVGSDAVPAFGEANPIENASAGGSALHCSAAEVTSRRCSPAAISPSTPRAVRSDCA